MTCPRWSSLGLCVGPVLEPPSPWVISSCLMALNTIPMPTAAKFISLARVFFLSSRFPYPMPAGCTCLDVSRNISNLNKSQTKLVVPSDLFVAGTANPAPSLLTLSLQCHSASCCTSLHKGFLRSPETIMPAHEVGHNAGELMVLNQALINE